MALPDFITYFYNFNLRHPTKTEQKRTPPPSPTVIKTVPGLTLMAAREQAPPTYTIT